MTSNRCEFLGMASTLLATSATVPAFLTRTAWAAAGKAPANDRVLVVLQLTGGNDGLNTVVPFTDPVYRRLRPTLSLADAKLHKLDDRVGLHPSMDGMKKLFDGGQAAVVQSVGYPNPNRSHFESMSIWQLAPNDAQLRHGRAALSAGGWLARAIDRRGDSSPAAAPALRVGTGEMPAALLGSRVQIPSLADLAGLKQRTGLLNRSLVEEQVAGWQSVHDPAANRLLAAAQASAVAVQATAAQIEKISPTQTADVKYPDNGLAERLRVIAQLIRAGFATPIYYTELGGFDTHSRQADNHADRLRQVTGALGAFIDDVTKHVASRPVLVLVFSEFGRRVEENASQGTDHGTAAPVFLAGSGVAPGVHGPHPDLAHLVDGDPIFGVDFRQVYATVLENWLGLASEPVLGQKFAALPLLKSIGG
jgi:uncharacterized protein (DUF1501 family)